MKANHPLRRAAWIWPGSYQDVRNTYAQFRRDFQLSSVPKKAPFYVTVDQAYMLYVNGQYVTRGPARGYQANWPFDEVDLAPYLVRGHNWISIQGYNAGISTFQYLHQTAAGLLCAGQFGKLEILSGPSWLMRRSPAHKRDTGRLSIQINFQEQIDTRLDDQSWIHSPRAPKGWDVPSFCRPFGVAPWHAMEERGIPQLCNEFMPYQNTCTAATGRSGEDYAERVNIGWGFHAENQSLQWKPAVPGKRTDDALAVTLPASGKGKFSAITMDLGQPGVGTLHVETAGNTGGELLDFYFCEVLTPEGAPLVSAPHTACDASMSARLWLRPGKLHYELFQMIGHRYLVAIARDTNHPLKLKLSLRHTAYPFDIKGAFRTDDAVLNDIYRISVRTQQCCALDSYVDTPWREQAQWWGDARVQAQNTFHISGDTRLLARGIRSIARQELPNGLTFGHAPTIAYTCILPDFSMIWALTIWDYYFQTGDVSLFAEQWPRIARLLAYFTGEGRAANGLIRYDERYWLFLDWCDISRDGTPALLNLWYLLMLERLAEMARVARMKPQQQLLTEMYEHHKRLVQSKFWDAKAKLFRDGASLEGKPVNVHSVHTQTLAIMCGLQPKHYVNMLEKRILPYLLDKKIPGATPSSYWVTYVYSVARQFGLDISVVEHIRKHWEPMIPFGGTWEIFANKFGESSVSHAWAAHPIYHLTGTIGGVIQSDVAWKRITFAPTFDLATVNKAAVTVPTPHGLISASWQRTDEGIDVALVLPKGITADVAIPGVEPFTATGKTRWLVSEGEHSHCDCGCGK